MGFEGEKHVEKKDPIFTIEQAWVYPLLFICGCGSWFSREKQDVWREQPRVPD
jgi:hypothetical protein